MKKILSKIIFVLLILTLLAKISCWFFSYSSEVKQMINTAMLSLIGISYIIVSFNLKKEVNKSVFMVCGAYLIIMNFIELNTMLEVIGILSIVIPILISKFSKDKIVW